MANDNITSADQDSGTSRINIYHERQCKQLCALHALNNLFQDPRAFSKQDLDEICKQLSPNSRLLNPHRSVLGLGCYDVNVIISALSKKDYEVIWFDKRKDLTSLNLDRIFGFILNVPNTSSNSLLAIPLNYVPKLVQIWSSQKHWIALRKIGRDYYNLDSKLESPCCVGEDDSLLQYLRLHSSMDQIEILVVVTKPVAEDQSWIKA